MRDDTTSGRVERMRMAPTTPSMPNIVTEASS